MVSINNLRPYGEQGWIWDVGVENPMNGFIEQTEYRTNSEGDGLWVCGSYEGKWANNYQDKQVAGTCQFSLPRNKRAARSKLYRQFRNDE